MTPRKAGQGGGRLTGGGNLAKTRAAYTLRLGVSSSPAIAWARAKEPATNDRARLTVPVVSTIAGSLRSTII